VYEATFPFGYGKKDGKVYVLHRGQVLTRLKNLPNDQLLINLNRFHPLDAKAKKNVIKCDKCGNSYADARKLQNHRRLDLCGVHDSTVLERDRVKDREVISTLPDAMRDQIQDLR